MTAASASASPEPHHVPPLVGCTVGVTAARRADELGAIVGRGYRLALDPAAGPVPVGGHCLPGDAR